MVKQNPGKGIAVLVFIFTLSFFAAVAGENIVFFFISLFILGMYVLPYYLPVTYTLTDSSVIIKTGWIRKERPWREFRRWKRSGKAIKLYTMKRQSRLDNYRSWLLRTGQKTDDVEAVVSRKIDHDE